MLLLFVVFLLTRTLTIHCRNGAIHQQQQHQVFCTCECVYVVHVLNGVLEYCRRMGKVRESQLKLITLLRGGWKLCS